MEKFSCFGELIYIGFVAEKGRCNSVGIWKFTYKKSFNKHIEILNKLIQCLSINEITDNDFNVLQELVNLIQRDELIGKYYPIPQNTIAEIAQFNKSLINTVEISNNYNRINMLMTEIATEILRLLDAGLFVNKEKILMLLRAIHNLPRVYLGSNKKTLCNLCLPSIHTVEAIEYCFSCLDDQTKQKYMKYYL